MRVGGVRKFNCLLSGPGYGDFPLVVTALGYGMNVIYNHGEAQTKRTFYPFKRTSGTWYVETQHGNREERDQLNSWLLQFIRRASSPWSDRPLAPLTVTVPSRNFVKTGYPTGSIDFGDSTKKTTWPMVISFSSASDPTSSALEGSRFVSASNSAAAQNFYPGERLSSSHVPPLEPTARVNDDTTYGGTTTIGPVTGETNGPLGDTGIGAGT